MRVLTVTVLITDRAIPPMDHYLLTLVLGNLAGNLDSLSLGVGLAGHFLAPFLPHRPATIVGHHVLIFLGHLSFLSPQARRSEAPRAEQVERHLPLLRALAHCFTV